MSEDIIFTMKNVSKIVPPKRYILKDIYLSYFYGAKIGVLGLNGSGKSSLLKIIAGVDDQYNGEVIPSRDYKIGFLQQEPELNEELTVRENVMEGLGELNDALRTFHKISEELCDPELDPDKMEKLIEKQAAAQEKIEAMDGWEVDQKIDQAMDALRCPPGDWPVNNLSGGERRRVALCRLLLSNYDVLLLDEPTNHLDAESVAWLEHYLQQFAGTVIAVTHDRYFLDNVAGWILELDRGEGIPFKGNYSAWLEQKNKRLAQEQRTNDRRAKTMEKELEWIRQSPKGRQAKSKARVSAYESLLKEPSQEQLQDMQIYIPPGPRLGEKVVEAKGLCKAFGDKLLMQDFSFTIPRGAIVGIVGPNGAGKSTLFNMIAGQEKPDKGELVLGDTVKMAYVDQSRADLSPEKTVFEEVSEGEEIIRLGHREVNARAYCSWFNFAGTDQQKKLGTMSGGERNRVHMAKLLKQEANFLLLDEPTNDLDVNTLRALEEAISNFGGSALIISHDRWFLDRVCTHTIGFEGDSRVVMFEGGYSEYEADLKQRLGVDTLIPKRIKYRKFDH